MQLILPAPTDDLDLSLESEQELVKKARISAQLAGYNSIRHFQIAAMVGIVKQHPLPPYLEQPKPKK